MDKGIKVEIGSYIFTIEKVDNLKGTNAETDLMAQKISISDKVSVDIENECILHEVLHAIWYIAIGVCQHAKFTEKQEELVIGHITPFLLDFIRRNPDIIYKIMNRQYLG